MEHDFSDRQRYDTLACYGNDWIKTPHLNALADQSFVFENTYVTQPVCAPARSSIMTGLYPHANGMPVNKLVMPEGVKTTRTSEVSSAMTELPLRSNRAATSPGS